MAGVHNSRPSAPGDPAVDHTWLRTLQRMSERADARETDAQRADRRLGELVSLINEKRPTWHRDAKCIGSQLDFTSTDPRVQRRALEVCGTCPMIRRCAGWADEVRDGVAVLGGETPTARRARWRRHTAENKET